MTNSLEDVIRKFDVFSDRDKLRFLASVSSYLTIAARSLATEGNLQQQRDALLAINELQHHVLQHLRAFLETGTANSGREILLALNERARSTNLLGHLHYALKNSVTNRESL